MQSIKWAIGTVILVGLLIAIIKGAFPFLFFPELPYESFVGRAMFVIILASGMCLFRISRGPSAADRIVAVDIFGILIVGFCAILTISTGRSWYIDIGIAWALQSFIGSLALAKYLEGKALDQ